MGELNATLITQQRRHSRERRRRSALFPRAHEAAELRFLPVK